MTPTKKPRSDSKLKNLPADAQETLWRLMHPEDKDTPAYSLEAACVHVQEELGISVGLSTLSEWHSWYALSRRMEAASERANQTRLELAQNSDLTPQDIERVAQTVFTAETLESGNVKAYVALAKLSLAHRALDLDTRRLAILEAKAKFADAVKAAAENRTGGVTAEEMAEIERKLKMM
jgi:hypothetical protein